MGGEEAERDLEAHDEGHFGHPEGCADGVGECLQRNTESDSDRVRECLQRDRESDSDRGGRCLQRDSSAAGGADAEAGTSALS